MQLAGFRDQSLRAREREVGGRLRACALSERLDLSSLLLCVCVCIEYAGFCIYGGCEREFLCSVIADDDDVRGGTCRLCVYIGREDEERESNYCDQMLPRATFRLLCESDRT